MDQQQPVQTSTQQPAQKPWWKRTGPSLAVAAGLLIIGSGFVHCVHGGVTTICWKDGFSLSDTFVDMNDYVGKTKLEMMDKAKVMRALEKCGVLTYSDHR